MIELYPSKLEGQPLERYKTDRVMTIEGWLVSNVKSYQVRESPPISIEVNGLFIDPANWAGVEFGPTDTVRIYPEPKGTGLEIAAWAVVAAIVAVGVIMLVQKPLITPSTANNGTGKALGLAKTTANQVKLGDVIRECSGKNEIFPDYLNPGRIYFGDDPKVQWVEMLLCIGVGEFEISAGQVRIGGTPIASLGSTASYTIYGPGQSLTAEDARMWWHKSEEVGSTSTGSAGLTLTTTSAIDPQVSVDTLQFSEFVISVPVGAGWFPHGWEAGLIARIESPYPYLFATPADGGPTVVSGDHLAMLEAFVGMKIEITGINAGDYVVSTYTAAVPATPAAAGSTSSITASAAPARYDYSATPAIFNLGGGPVLNLLVDTYSWPTSTSLPTVTVSAGTTVTGIAIAAAASGFGYQITTGSTSNGLWFMLSPTNNVAGWNLPLSAGVHTISFDASSSIDGATIQPGIWNGVANLGPTISISATRTRYSFTVTVASPSTFGVIFYVNRAGINGNNVVIDSVQVSKGATLPAFARGTRAVTLNTSTGSIAGLVSAINAKISGSGLVASASGGVIKITEAGSPFSGLPLTLTGSTTDVFGATPVFVTGSKTNIATAAQPPKMTLAHDSGAPVSGLQAGSVLCCIGYRDLRYRISAVADDAVDDDEGTPDVDESHGPSSISVIRLTDTGAENTGWAGFDDLETSGAKITLDNSTTEGDWAGPFVACPAGEVVRVVELDFFFPQGLVRYTERNGNIRQVSAKVEVQYRDAATAGAWTAITYTFTAMSQDQQGYTRRITMPTYIRPEYRTRRIGEESTSTSKFDRVQWYGMRARIPKQKDSYEGVTVIALYVRGGDKLSAQSQSQVSVVATRKLPVLVDGAWSEPTATRDIVPWVNHVMKSVGGTDEDMDVEELARYDELWSGRGDYFDYKVEDDSTVKECLNDGLLAGFAEFTLERGSVTPVRDELRSQIGHMYTPQIMTQGLKRNFTLLEPDAYDGVDIKYVDEVTRAKEVVPCRLPGDAGDTVQTVTLKGVADRDRAWRYGMRLRRAQVYRNKSYSWSTEFDALNSGYMSYDAVADDIPGYGQSSILMDATSEGGHVLLESSEPLVWKAGASHVVGLRRPDGTVSGPWPATRVDDFTVSVPSLDFEPDVSWGIEPPHMLFGETTRWCYPVLITSIDPGDHSADVEAVNYDPRVYADDDNFAPT